MQWMTRSPSHSHTALTDLFPNSWPPLKSAGLILVANGNVCLYGRGCFTGQAMIVAPSHAQVLASHLQVNVLWVSPEALQVKSVSCGFAC